MGGQMYRKTGGDCAVRQQTNSDCRNNSKFLQKHIVQAFNIITEQIMTL